jgi:hypothetical protein
MTSLQWLKSVDGISEFASVGFSQDGTTLFALSNGLMPAQILFFTTSTGNL